MKNKISHICNALLRGVASNWGIEIVMRASNYNYNSAVRKIAAVILLSGLAVNVFANPTGMTVVHGRATAQQNGSQLSITTSQAAYLNWSSFNIQQGETTTFIQPSSSSVVVNNIGGASASQIYGNLEANGIVVLMNPSGFYFGPDSFVQTAGLVVSTAQVTPPQNSAGGSWEFNGPPPLASIVNYGQINVGKGGPAYLIAEGIENHGIITAPGGNIALAAGQKVLLSDRPDGRGVSLQVTLPSGSVDNEGKLIADGGTISVNANVVNQNGIVQANSVQSQNGVIELVAADQLNLGANSQISASGDNSVAGSSGGTITLKSENNFNDSAGSEIVTTGGSQGGNGGSVEISAPNVQSLNSGINARAQAGWTAGTLLLDPDYIILDTSGGGVVPANGTVSYNSNPGTTLDLNVNSAFANIAVSQITLQAVNDITLAAGTMWNLSGTIGANFGGVTSGQLTLEAGRNIIFGDGSLITDANNWSLALDAGYKFANDTVQAGVGNIYLNGGPDGDGVGGSIQMDNDNSISPTVNLVAGQDITVGSGYVITTAGGSISAHALKGNIDTGSDAQGYHFINNAGSLNSAYNLSDGLGGISTEAGGDVNLTAGGNVTSVLPGKGSYYYDGTQVTTPANNDYYTAGSGAYGNQPGQSGDITIVAGGNVSGNYLVANGTGSIFAGVEMDANGNPVKDSSGNYVMGASGNAGADLENNGLALTLINGGWNVTAAQNIFLQEVRNPNGDFDTSGTFSHYLNYAPGDFVNLSAGNLVQLGASVPLPRVSGAQNNVPVIYPSILNITAGDGGVILGTGNSPNSLILFPSSQGSLTIDTTGSLVSDLNAVQNAPQLFNLIVSDAGHNQYTTTANFGINDHAASPIHANNPTPVSLNIGGDMNLVFLSAPEAAQINVGGDMNNCGFQGMNLSSAPSFQDQVQEADGSTRTFTVSPGVTSINVAGDINNRSAFTSINLDLNQSQSDMQVQDMAYLSQAVNNSINGTSISQATLAASLNYNPATQTLTYQNQNISGVTVAQILNLLQNLTVQKVDSRGNLLWLDADDTIPDTEQVSILTPEMANALLAQYNALGAPPIDNAAGSSIGYTIGGGGQFNITARTVDIGTSAGISSYGGALYSVRASYPLAGLFGDGGVFNRGADINITTTGNNSAGENSSGDLIGDLDLFSSSIASFFGGNISINAGGNVNAGSSVFSVAALGTRGIYSTSGGDVTVIAGANINVNGSRIATYDGGNITVESLDGDVNAGTGASTPVSVSGFYEDPSTHAIYSDSPQIPFSGILALTFPAGGSSYPAPTPTLGNILIEAPNGDVSANTSGILQISENGLKYPDATTTVQTGYELNNNGGLAFELSDKNIVTFGATTELSPPINGAISLTQLLDANGAPVLDATGHQIYVENFGAQGGPLITFNFFVVGNQSPINPYVDSGGEQISAVRLPDTSDSQGNPIFVYGRNIDAIGSGIIASNAKLDATGDINGLIFARNNIDINAQQNVDVTALGGGNVNVSSTSGTISGEIVGVGSVSVSGSSIDASLVSGNVSGATSGQSGLGQGTSANSTSQSASSDISTKAVADSDNTDDEKKKRKQIALAQKISRVTVVLPPKNKS